MPSTSSAKLLESPPEPVILHEEEIPDPVETKTETVTPTTQTTTGANPTPTTTPSPPTQTGVGPTLLPVFQALAMVLAARTMGLLLVVSAVVFGFLTINDPIPLRLVAGAGYAVFCLTALWVLPKR